MARNRLLLTLAVVAIGFLALGTVLTPEALASKIYGTVSLGFTGQFDATVTVYLQKLGSPAPPVQKQVVSPPPYDYEFDNLDAGTYHVWAVYEDDTKICTSETHVV